MTTLTRRIAAITRFPRESSANTPWRLALRQLRADKTAVTCFCILATVILMAVFADLIALATGHPPNEQYRETGLTLAGLPVAPNAEFWFGTDNLGRDLLVRIAFGARTSLLVGIVATVIASLGGLVLGLIAGYFGGWVDALISRFMDIVLSFPYLLAAIALVALLGPSIGVAILVIAFFSFASVGRIVRGQTLSLRAKEFIEASRASGSGRWRTMIVDVVPNLMAPLLVYATLLIPVAIVFEASLSFLGLGISPPTASWGSMLADSIQYYQFSWWFVVFPGLALLITTVSFNLLGDSVRDAFSPQMQRGGK